MAVLPPPSKACPVGLRVGITDVWDHRDFVYGRMLRNVYCRVQARFPSRVRMGWLHAGGNGRQPAVGAYCKVFVRRGGRISFHKDGYCDLRGMFDYSSVSSGLRPGEGGYRGGSVKYAVLVTSPQWGSFIQETS